MCRHRTLGAATAAGDAGDFRGRRLAVLVLRLWWSPYPLIGFPVATALVEPRDNVREHQLHVLVRLAGGEAVPHPRVELDGLVGAGRALVEGAADLGVGHRVGLTVQDEEWHRHLWKHIKKQNEGRPAVVASVRLKQLAKALA